MLLERVHSLTLSGKKKAGYDLVNYMNTRKRRGKYNETLKVVSSEDGGFT